MFLYFLHFFLIFHVRNCIFYFFSVLETAEHKPCRTRMPPAFPPPTTTHIRPVSAVQSCGSGWRFLLGGKPFGAGKSLSLVRFWMLGSIKNCMRIFFSAMMGCSFISFVNAFRLADTPFREPSKPNFSMTGIWTVWHAITFASIKAPSSFPALS